MAHIIAVITTGTGTDSAGPDDVKLLIRSCPVFLWILLNLNLSPGPGESVTGPVMINCDEICHVFCNR